MNNLLGGSGEASASLIPYGEGMTDLAGAPRPVSLALTGGSSRGPASKLGVAVVRGIVTAIVTGEIEPGASLPNEAALTDTFGVSRTVIRESVKRVEEKGLIAIEQGRGMRVLPPNSWNVLDPIVLSAMVEHDDSLGVLDDLAVVRASLEASMAALTAERRDEAELAALGDALARMEAALDDETTFNEADAQFHLIVMGASHNTLADSITRILFQRARESERFRGHAESDELRLSFEEHRLVYEAIKSRNPYSAEIAMRTHIRSAWARRRVRDTPSP